MESTIWLYGRWDVYIDFIPMNIKLFQEGYHQGFR